MSVLNDLGQTILPDVFGALNTAGLTDLMDITGETLSQDSGGAVKQTVSAAVYEDVPVSYRPLEKGNRFSVGDRQVSVQEYELTFPTHQAGTRINFDIKAHRFTVQARGNEPAKVFRPIRLKDVSGVVFKVICQKEN